MQDVAASKPPVRQSQVTGRLHRALYGLSLGVLGYKLAVLALNALTFPRLKRAKADLGRVSVLIPARDEAANLRRTLPPLLSQGALEVLVLDDGSQDDTAQVARQLGAALLDGKPLPDGWVGKNWACYQLAQAARGDVLLFTDADVDWHAGALQAALHELERMRADLLSVWPRQHNRTLGERLLTPLLDNLLLGWFPAPIARLPYPDAAAAIGQVMVFRRAAYWALGGHTAVRGSLMEDMALARTVKVQGGRLAVALGGDLLGVRMYRDYPESVRGIAKMTLPFHRGWRWALPLTWTLHVAVYLLPWLRGWRLPIALSVLEGLAVRGITGRTRRFDLLEVAFTPLLPVLTLPVYFLAARRRVGWKGRQYPSVH